MCVLRMGLMVPPRRPLICCVTVLVRRYRRALAHADGRASIGVADLRRLVGTRGPEVVPGRRPSVLDLRTKWKPPSHDLSSDPTVTTCTMVALFSSGWTNAPGAGSSKTFTMSRLSLNRHCTYGCSGWREKGSDLLAVARRQRSSLL
ncbi:hypothetical protein MTO96_009875 [Rhipicephalus appendiculatus]